MNPDQVRRLIETQVGDDWEISNHHHVDLRRALITPRRIGGIVPTVRDGEVAYQKCSVWLVLLEEAEDGYRIVMKEDEPVFGLACKGFPTDDSLVVIGWYGDFVTTFLAM